MTTDQERPLPGMGRGAPAPSRAVARRSGDEVRVTPQGDNAADIVGDWVGWCQEGTGVPIPQSLIARMGKQVRGLIITGYATNAIKFALAVWTVQEQENPRLSPVELDRICWRFARDTSAQARAWRDKVKQQINEFSRVEGVSTGAPVSNKSAREQRTLQAIQMRRQHQ